MTTMTELHQAVASEDYDLVEEIVKSKRCNPNQKDVDWDYRTPLHWAAAKGQADAVRILLEHGASPCLRTASGWTPTHFAAESGRLGVLRLLHSAHAPIDTEDCSGDRPMRIAQIYGHKDCVEFLKTAEEECRAYRKQAHLKGFTLEDVDEEWEEQKREIELNRHAKQNTICDSKQKMTLHSVKTKGKTHVSKMSTANK
ncbi:ankyrin repeat domain-containing protein 66 isoform X1 [Paramormyrops kingsleyae]|uniref:ankyrin repeat domain-containing protein 66 isoform X1 n=1 Tax=Paramormyrops kingsleyae TaxID=1676925 RepID=UPI003B9716C4